MPFKWSFGWLTGLDNDLVSTMRKAQKTHKRNGIKGTTVPTSEDETPRLTHNLASKYE